MPSGYEENLKWRAKVHRRALEDPEFVAGIWEACSKDILFYMAGFLWTYDPRKRPWAKVPFIPYEFQEESLEVILSCIGVEDLLILKSRDMGASWMNAVACEWMWHFSKSEGSLLFGSRTEEYVESKDGNPKSLFFKIDYILNTQPEWLLPEGFNIHNRECRSKLHLRNPATGYVIDGESTTGDFARGDRRTAILLDEFAAVENGHKVLGSTRDVTNSRIFNSTPAGTGNAFYAISQTNIRTLRLHWTLHPEKARGLYTTDKQGCLEVLDQDGYSDEYHPILDGKTRSPWYDRECERCVSVREIAAELDMDFGSSQSQFFDVPKVNEAIRKYARTPGMVGDLEYDIQTGEPDEFRDSANGLLKLWVQLDGSMKPSLETKYVIGCDVSAGSGASNSCLAIWDKVLRTKAGEFTTPYVRPEALAYQAVAIAKLFGNATLIWEDRGPGQQFGARILDLNYGNVFTRKAVSSITRRHTDKAGWAPGRESKLRLMGAYRTAIEKDRCANFSREALEECLEYIFDGQGGVKHAAEDDKMDPSGANAQHGDRVMADAMAWHCCTEVKPKICQEQPEIPIGSLAWRKQQRNKKKENKGELGNGW